ncbi:HpcH/HpaI aldolase/citrate lyase family protein [Nocardia vermiculata]|uniref:CoA ester lyase n=1 Tax=Nocardia vermiculata TaxID=257274 RepID=A0A846Y0K4_9NOCA|nr:CoA ester lyase [Nocardia vermiculata]NKY51540.1 CoA ester lyase [Nocardia vermiculata]
MIATRRRTTLVAPGSDERTARKALGSHADEVVLDLEDAVTAARKDEARRLVVELAREYGARRAVSVRINGPNTPWFGPDLSVLGRAADFLASLVIPKVENAAELEEIDRILHRGGDSAVRVQALVETPCGVRNVDAIAAGPRLEAMVIGYADLGAALGRSQVTRPEQWLYVQDRVLHAAREAGVQAIDGPFLDLVDMGAFRRAAQWAADLGFDGKWVVHPVHIDPALEIFTPSGEDADFARRVLAALEAAEERGAGAVQLDGRMLDEAVAVAARRIVARIGAR